MGFTYLNEFVETISVEKELNLSKLFEIALRIKVPGNEPLSEEVIRFLLISSVARFTPDGSHIFLSIPISSPKDTEHFELYIRHLESFVFEPNSTLQTDIAFNMNIGPCWKVESGENQDAFTICTDETLGNVIVNKLIEAVVYKTPQTNSAGEIAQMTA